MKYFRLRLSYEVSQWRTLKEKAWMKIAERDLRDTQERERWRLRVLDSTVSARWTDSRPKWLLELLTEPKYISQLFRKKEERSDIKSELHRKKDRQRNLIPAKTGILVLTMVFLSSIIYCVMYGMTSQNFDVYTRSYYLGFLNDLFPCFISPMIVVFEAPVIRRKIDNLFYITSKYVLKIFSLLLPL